MSAYYNENDPFAAAWLRELIKAGHIAPGDVDERSVEDVRPVELAGYKQCHFFAGIGVWSYALRRAGWPDDRQVWTGSCPCQPFSSAGKRGGVADERHLWPAWFHLIEQCRPGVVFGEQVASKDGLAWLDLVQADMEAAHYAIGPVDLCAAGVGAPHIRQRLWLVAQRIANTVKQGPQKGIPRREDSQRENEHGHAGRGGAVGGLAKPDEQQRDGSREARETRRGEPANSGAVAGPTNGYWRSADWLFCRDGKFRPVEPGTFPLVDGTAARVGRLRGYGNAINAEAAKEVISAYMDIQ